jgi:hypothetical protein
VIVVDSRVRGAVLVFTPHVVFAGVVGDLEGVIGDLQIADKCNKLRSGALPGNPQAFATNGGILREVHLDQHPAGRPSYGKYSEEVSRPLRFGCGQQMKTPAEGIDRGRRASHTWMMASRGRKLGGPSELSHHPQGLINSAQSCAMKPRHNKAIPPLNPV